MSIKRPVPVADPALLILRCTLGFPGSLYFNFLIAPSFERLDAIRKLIRAQRDVRLFYLLTWSLSGRFLLGSRFYDDPHLILDIWPSRLLLSVKLKFPEVPFQSFS